MRRRTRGEVRVVKMRMEGGGSAEGLLLVMRVRVGGEHA